MSILCICINCKYYKSCWINLGIKKLKTNKASFKFFTFKNAKLEFTKSLYINVKLHKFLKRNEFEFDIFTCDAFLESPGNWLN